MAVPRAPVQEQLCRQESEREDATGRLSKPWGSLISAINASAPLVDKPRHGLDRPWRHFNNGPRGHTAQFLSPRGGNRGLTSWSQRGTKQGPTSVQALPQPSPGAFPAQTGLPRAGTQSRAPPRLSQLHPIQPLPLSRGAQQAQCPGASPCSQGRAEACTISPSSLHCSRARQRLARHWDNRGLNRSVPPAVRGPGTRALLA
ncbi:hypothetical protein KIL84_002324 [Mauremys mutica]|uniref:Uncharacterized protein n=1 Tax=Mauremys mutica TaxID=74926 RepID=A0A9D4AZ62_9SAUR|nr:hypothetical protein KIL84_002324 [Mauremys mutica]